MSSRPNVLIFMCDQMQHSRLGLDDPNAYTPNLDRLAQQGVRFTNAFTNHGQCVPSRAVFQTGLYAHEVGVLANFNFHGHIGRITLEHETLGNVFQRAGYETAYFGKSHLGQPLGDLGYEHNFQSEKREVPQEKVDELGIEYVNEKLRKDYYAFDEAMKFLSEYEPGDRPLMFTYSTNMPHPPFFDEKRFISRFNPDDLPLPESYYSEEFGGKPSFQKEHVEDGRHGAGSEASARRELAQYYSMIAAVDDNLGRLLDRFNELGILDNTIVLFFADHGDMMNGHRIRLKGTLPYDELYRIPCILRLPRTGANGRAPGAAADTTGASLENIVSIVQLPGTLCRLAGIEPPEQYRHGDILPLLERLPEHVSGTDSESPSYSSELGEEALFFEHYAAYWGVHPFYGVRTKSAKYVYYLTGEGEELYLLGSDPYELHNVADDPDQAETKARLKRAADRWWNETDGKSFEYYEKHLFNQET